MKDSQKGKKIEGGNQFPGHYDNTDKDISDSQRKAERRKRRKELFEERKKRIFKSTTDPHETPLKWWEKEPVKYA